MEESLINMNIIVFIIGFMIGILLTMIVYHKHPVRIIREHAKRIIKTFTVFKHRHAEQVPMTGESANGEIPDFIKRDMKAYERMREHRIHQYDFLEPDYQPTAQEQAYLNIIHDVKTTDKDADTDK